MERKRASDFPQELLNLFDQYVHGGISRRAFLDGAQNFAVGGVTPAALFEMLKPNYAWASNWRSSGTKQRSVLARRGYRLNTPSAWRPPSNSSPFPMTLAAIPRCLPPEPTRNIASHMRGNLLPLP